MGPHCDTSCSDPRISSQKKAQGVVLKISCVKCPSTFIDKTKTLPPGITQHENDVRTLDLERSVVEEHWAVFDHPIDSPYARVI